MLHTPTMPSARRVIQTTPRALAAARMGWHLALRLQKAVAAAGLEPDRAACAWTHVARLWAAVSVLDHVTMRHDHGPGTLLLLPRHDQRTATTAYDAVVQEYTHAMRLL